MSFLFVAGRAYRDHLVVASVECGSDAPNRAPFARGVPPLEN